MISRDFYLQQLITQKDTDFIKIITGIRRCGKSSLLILFQEYLLQHGVKPGQIISINYEKFQYDELRDAKTLHDYIAQRISPSYQKYYLFMDEVQEIPQWAKVVNSLRVSFPVDIYVTGSNSRIFSGEYLTYISGRYTEIKVYPLSFQEFLHFRNIPVEQAGKAWNEYLQIGSFPATALTTNQELIESINAGLFDSIFSRDIILRGKLRNEGNFFKVAKFVVEGIGSPVSANAIAKALKSQGHQISVDSVDNYLVLMCNAFLLYQCERYDIRGKERLRSNGKYYISDMGLRNQLIGIHPGNRGHILENMVYLELKRLGYEVYVGKLQEQEIDFIITKGSFLAYVQVALSALDEKVLQRELAPFYAIPDNHPKYLITMDQLDLSQDGIIHLNLFDFLLKDTTLRNPSYH